MSTRSSKSYSNLQDLNSKLLQSRQQQQQQAKLTFKPALLPVLNSPEDVRDRSSTFTSIDSLNFESIRDTYILGSDSEGDSNHHHHHRNQHLSESVDSHSQSQSQIQSQSNSHSPDPRHVLQPPVTNSTGANNDNDHHHNPESPTWRFSEILISFGSIKDKDEYYILSKGNDLILLLKTYPNLKNDILIKNLINRIQFMFVHRVTEIRSLAYKILRYIITNFESLMILVQSKMLIFIIITMSTTRSSLVEKEQALKLIREFLTIERGSELLSIGVIKSLISVIECNNEHLNQLSIELNDDINNINNNNNHNNNGMSFETNDHYQSHQGIPDGFKNVCIETICEISLSNPELVFHSGGFKVIINTLIDGNFEMSTSCLVILFKILDYKNNRKFLRNGFDLNSIISIFSNELGNSTNDSSSSKYKKLNNSRLQKISFLITLLLKNFNGLMAFSINQFETLNELIINLRKKHPKIRDYILDIIFDILRIKSLPWLSSTSIGDNINKFNNYLNPTKSDKGSFIYQELNKSVNEFEYNLINHYRGLLTLILIKNNIFQYLTEIIEENTDSDNTTKATILLTNIYSLANNLLPPELINKDLILPKFSSLSSSFEFEKFTRTKFHPSKVYNKNLQNYISTINQRSKYNIEDSEIKALITNTKVIHIKEFEEWNWKTLSTLIQGPLTNPKRFDEILEKNPKFLKRLISFYRPFKFRFCNLPLSKRQSSTYLEIGVQLFEMLVGFESGLKYLSSCKILPQLSEIFAQIDPYSGIDSKDPILSREKLRNTCSYGYLRFIGVLTTKSEGLKLLEKWQFTNLLLNIIDNSRLSHNTDYLIVNLFKYVDFTKDSQFRNLLSQCLKISNFKVKYDLLNHLIPKLLNTKECELFILKLLVNNLYDESEGEIETNHIVSDSIDLLYDYFNKLENLDNLPYFINLRPSITILNSHHNGKRLLLNFLKSSLGFKYLDEFGYIDERFNNWVITDGFQYLNKIETLIYANFFPYVTIETTNSNDSDYYSINFFKYLLSTEEGLNYFTNFHHKNYIDQLIKNTEIVANKLLHDDEFLDNFENNYNDKEEQNRHLILLNNLKQNLWIIGNIASGTYGIQLLLNNTMYTGEIDTSIISTILELFKFCPIWQIRGICFYVLGMISSTEEGVEILDELNWVTVFDQYSHSKSLCYPRQDITNIFNVEITNPYRNNRYYAIFNSGTSATLNITDMWNDSRNGSLSAEGLIGDSTNKINDNSTNSSHNSRENLILFDTNEIINNRVIYLLQYLNAVIGKIERKATKELIKLKRSSPEIFENTQLFLEVIKLIDKGNFKFEKRKFIFDLFLNTKVLETLLKRERKNSIKV
ncbi:Rapamycin-insensitive companion of mTOR, middle domain-containing protein [Scheffersomyces amazonensis]|uniref:Rapamycin-insensitive companion of mTOR, middle domain-containing protein n=1 Tax=Scheffersomyces amazonensis TaxID=1078765 RepID=UPI00315D1E1B